MKKIITLFDVLNTPWHVLSFAIKIAQENVASITGIFLKPRRTKSEYKYPFPNDLSLTEDKLSNEFISHENALLLEDNIKLFKDECESEKVAFEIQKEVSIKEFIVQSLNSQLIIADTRADFIDDVLPEISCPVCLISENELPQKLLLMLDEGLSSRNAIEKFAALFPGLTTMPAQLVSINLKEEEQLANEQFINHNLNNTYPRLTKYSLQGNIEKELLKFLGDEPERIMVVMGAFGRSDVSRFFRDSLAKVILDKTRLSLFIVHK